MTTEYELNERIGQNIRMLRCYNDMTQDMLGAKLNITGMQVSRYERGKNAVDAATLYVIAKLFNVSTEVFFKKVVD